MLRANAVNAVEKPNKGDWEELERMLGFALPADFVELLSAFGSGQFGRGLYLKNPAATSPYLVLSKESLVAFKQCDPSFERRSNVMLYPPTGGLVLIGGIDRQLLFYEPCGRTVNRYQLVYIDSDLFEVHRIDCSVSEFIERLYCGKVHTPWASALREYVWPDRSFDFFTPIIAT
jgi:hypothetical protein